MPKKLKLNDIKKAGTSHELKDKARFKKYSSGKKKDKSYQSSLSKKNKIN
jgi:hypothetical protein